MILLIRVFALMFILGCVVGSAHALDACESKAVEVAVRDYVVDTSRPGAYIITLDISDSCPDNDEFEGVYMDVNYYVRRTGEATGTRFGGTTGGGGNIYPSKSHSSVHTTHFSPRPGFELVCVSVVTIKVTGSIYVRYPDVCKDER